MKEIEDRRDLILRPAENKYPHEPRRTIKFTDKQYASEDDGKESYRRDDHRGR
jgi:hypothetical protein